MEIRVAGNAGFCFGVKRAVDAVLQTIGQYENIYTLGELIHNGEVISMLEKKGVKIAEAPADIKEGGSTVLVIRSHGVAKGVYGELEKRGCEVLDMTCPFVKRIHEKVAAAGDTPVIIVGAHKHPEVIGIKGWAAGEVYIAEDKEGAEKLPALKSALVVAQTTITQALFDEVVTVLRGKTENLMLFNSICDTTKKRQSEAESLAKACTAMLVVGGENSSNTRKLYELCKMHCEKTYYIENSAQFSLENIQSHDIIGIVAGASTPDWLIREVKTRMSELENMQGTVTENDATEQQEATAQPAQENVPVAEEAAPAEAQETAAAASDEQEKANEDFMAEIDKSFVYIKRGQIVTGTVVQVSDSEICVNIGYKSDGIIKKEMLTQDGDQSPADLFNVGDEIEAEVVSLNDGEGNVVLSRKSIESKLKWKELVENLDTERTYTVKVERVVKGGVLAKLEGYDAFIPASQLSLKYVEDLSEFVGQDLEVNIIEVDKRQRRFVLSHKAVLLKEQAEKEKEIYQNFHKGDKIKGKIKQLTDFGAFIDVGGVDGLLHITDISWVKVKHPSEVLTPGDEIEVQVLNVDPEKKRISLGLKQLMPRPWDLVADKYLVGDSITGTVVRIMPFGAFVSLEPTVDGLVHISQVTNRRLEKVEEELRIGDEVTAKIMEVDPAKKRISLSIRALMAEPEKKERSREERGGERQEKFTYEIPPVEGASTSLADLFSGLNTGNDEEDAPVAAKEAEVELEIEEVETAEEQEKAAEEEAVEEFNEEIAESVEAEAEAQEKEAEEE